MSPFCLQRWREADHLTEIPLIAAQFVRQVLVKLLQLPISPLGEDSLNPTPSLERQAFEHNAMCE